MAIRLPVLISGRSIFVGQENNFITPAEPHRRGALKKGVFHVVDLPIIVETCQPNQNTPT